MLLCRQSPLVLHSCHIPTQGFRTARYYYERVKCALKIIFLYWTEPSEFSTFYWKVAFSWTTHMPCILVEHNLFIPSFMYFVLVLFMSTLHCSKKKTKHCNCTSCHHSWHSYVFHPFKFILLIYIVFIKEQLLGLIIFSQDHYKKVSPKGCASFYNAMDDSSICPHGGSRIGTGL